MNQELERLIDFALADGILTDKEKEILYKKAIELGERNPQLLNLLAIYYNRKKVAGDILIT